MFISHRILGRASLCALVSLPILLAGCSGGATLTGNSGATPLAKGNWQISSSAAAAAHLPVLSGEFNTQAGAITGTLHSQSANACIAPQTSFTVSGAADAKDAVTLTGPLAGGTLTLTGTLAADGRSLTDASYNVAGGACAFAQPASAIAQNFAPITGNYVGNFADADGQLAQVTANFSQSTTPDANGNFTLAGTATVPSNPCFPTSVPISNTQVTGGTFTFTYAANGSGVTANGTFAADASTLTVNSWTASGACGADTGTQSVMTKH